MKMVGASGPLGTVEAVLMDGRLGAWGDDALLRRFTDEAGERSERAFAALVERHGARVYRVCRAVTGDGHAAEDAFQATFLVLARKAGALKVGDSLGPWLHGVAARVAASARLSEDRRRRREAAVAIKDQAGAIDRVGDDDLTRILHLEIDRLPRAFREAVYLCDVEGIDQQTAAVRLGCAVGTIKSRLNRARKRLQSRLLRRGIAPGLIASRATSAGSTEVPARLVEATVRGSVALASGASSGMVPAAAVALFQEAMTSMLRTKLRVMAGAAVLGFSAAVASVWAQDPVPRKPGSASSTQRDTTTDDLIVTPAPAGATKHVNGPGGAPLPGTAAGVSGAPIPIVDALAPGDNRPTESEVLAALFRHKFRDVKINVEKVLEVVDPPHDYPLAGRCQLVHAHYKVTVTYVATGEKPDQRIDTIDFDRDFLRRVSEGGDTPKKPSDAAPRGESGAGTSAAPKPGTSPSDTGRRLEEVERKLDRILKALEAPAPPSSTTPHAETK